MAAGHDGGRFPSSLSLRGAQRRGNPFPFVGADAHAAKQVPLGTSARCGVSRLASLNEGFAVLNDRPVACQTREPTDPQGDVAWPQAMTEGVFSILQTKTRNRSKNGLSPSQLR